MTAGAPVGLRGRAMAPAGTSKPREAWIEGSTVETYDPPPHSS